MKQDVLTSNRKIDTPQERIVDKFLLHYFYNKCFNTVEQVLDYDRQVKGVDIVADGLLIDNKAQSSPRYVNKPTNTFILELGFLNRNSEETLGWFIDNENITSHYLFVWIHDATVDEHNRLVDDGIHKVEVMLVDKTKLREGISLLYDDAKLCNIIDDMRRTESTSGLSKSYGFKFSHSPQLFEKPVNIVAKKWYLKNFAIKHCMVTCDEVIDIVR